MAEGVMKSLIQKHRLDWTIDSAGTEYYHVGERPDRRAIAQCLKHRIDISIQKARRISAKDFSEYDLVYALSDDVLEELQQMNSSGKNHSSLMLLMDEVCPGENCSVPDPWYGGEKDFEHAFQLIQQACEAIIQRYSPEKKAAG